MDDLTLRYYEAEMRYLREAGKEFAQAHPDRAALLNLDRVGDRDPYVERLFEGFAFLTGRLRQKLDDDLPELTEGLVGLLWPHYLRMIPSLTVLEMTPQANTLQQMEAIDAGLPVQSSPIGVEATRCLYRTTQPVTLMPLRLTRAQPSVGADGRSVIQLAFRLEDQVRHEQLNLSRLRLYLAADKPIAFALRHALLQQVQSVRWRLPGIDAGLAQALPSVHFAPVGFSPEDRLWPKADNAFGGYQLLLEYFCFREKFLFIDLCGLDVGQLPETQREFVVEAVLDKTYPSDMPFSAADVRLYCTPAINLFELEAEPIRVDHHAHEYRVTPLYHYGMQVETYSVDAVQAFDHADGQRHEYVPFSTFRHRGGMLRHDAPERYFHTRVRRGASGRYETWLMLGGHRWDQLDDLPVETLSLRVTGTNGMLPRKALRESQIMELAGGVPNVAQLRNLSAPTLPCYPPMEDRFQWRVLSHLAPNYLSLMDAEVLRGTLALYDWTEDELNRRRLTGILEVKHRLIQRVEQGCIHRGIAIEVTLDSQQFAGEGDLFLFGELLSRFFAAYADMNLFTRLAVTTLPEGARHEWNDSKAVCAPL